MNKRPAWAGSTRSSRLPKNWNSLRLFILRRDRWRCQMNLDGCLSEATDVDHIVAGDNHSSDNLRAVCRSCHKKKTSAEAQSAQAKKRASRYRPRERHPGEK